MRTVTAVFASVISGPSGLPGSTLQHVTTVLSYSRLIHGLKQAEIGIDRKILALLAVTDPTGFGSIVEKAKSQLQ